MNEILAPLVIASMLKSVKNEEKKAKLRPIALAAVRGFLLAYSDDEAFMAEVLEG